MNARTVDLMTRCQARRRRRAYVIGLSWWRGRKVLRCVKRPGHEGSHSYEVGGGA